MTKCVGAEVNKAPRLRSYAAVVVATLALLGASCGSTAETSASDTTAATAESSESEAAPTNALASEERIAQSAAGEFPEITSVEAQGATDGTWTIEVTVSSPYDSPERYADAWRVLDQDGNELGIRELAHDHADEQPFTRTLEGVEIPEGVEKLTVEGRDSVNGWGGQIFVYSLPGDRTY